MTTTSLPKPVSSQVHRTFDIIALPALLSLATFLRRKNSTAAAVVLTNAVIEGFTQLVTDYSTEAAPRGRVRWISLDDHLRITGACSSFLALLAWRMRGLRPMDRGLVLGLAGSALVLSTLTDPGRQACCCPLIG